MATYRTFRTLSYVPACMRACVCMRVCVGVCVWSQDVSDQEFRVVIVILQKCDRYPPSAIIS